MSYRSSSGTQGAHCVAPEGRCLYSKVSCNRPTGRQKRLLPSFKQESGIGQITWGHCMKMSVRVLCNTCFIGHFWRRIWWWHSILHISVSNLNQDQVKTKSNLHAQNLQKYVNLIQFCLRMQKSFILKRDKKNLLRSHWKETLLHQIFRPLHRQKIQPLDSSS